MDIVLVVTYDVTNMQRWLYNGSKVDLHEVVIVAICEHRGAAMGTRTLLRWDEMGLRTNKTGCLGITFT